MPPICVDVNADGVQDILLLTFDGHLALYNGKTLKPIWIADFHGMQSYRLVCVSVCVCVFMWNKIMFCGTWYLSHCHMLRYVMCDVSDDVIASCQL